MRREEAEELLLGIIESVEAGVTAPEAAVDELNLLKKSAPQGFKGDYTLEDFVRIQEKASTEFFDGYGFEENIEEDEEDDE